EPGIQDLRAARGAPLPGLVGVLGRDLPGVQLLQPRRVVVHALGLVQGKDLSRGQLIAGHVIIVIPPAAQIVTASARREVRAAPASRTGPAEGTVRWHAAAGRLVIALAWFRRRSLLCCLVSAYVDHSMAWLAIQSYFRSLRYRHRPAPSI